MTSPKSPTVSLPEAVEALRSAVQVEREHGAISDARDAEIQSVLSSHHDVVFVGGKINMSLAADLLRLEGEKRASDIVLASLSRQLRQTGPLIAAEIETIGDRVSHLHAENLKGVRDYIRAKLASYFEAGPPLENAINTSKHVRTELRFAADHQPASSATWWVNGDTGESVLDSRITAGRIVQAFDSASTTLADVEAHSAEVAKRFKL